MADEMNTERDMPEGITRDDTVHGETYYTAADMATASAQGFRGGVASLSSPLQSALDVIERWARDAYVVCGKPSTQEGFESAWKAEDADAYAVWVAGRASLAANAPAATAADGKWYMLSRDGMATLCADRDDAMTEAASADKLYPAGAPHRALQLVAANAGSDGVASLSAAEPAAQFDAQGFREWVLRNLPKGSVIGNGEWWADHLTQWAQRFVKKEAPALTQGAAIADRTHALRSTHGQAPAQPDAPLPLLVRDIAAELGITVPEACKSLFAAGCGETSVNMAVTPRMARALRAMHPTPSPQAAQQAPNHPIAPDIAADLERSDWTPEEALRWYATGKHYDTVPNGDGTSSARILDNGAVASNALKALSRDYAEHKGDVALLEAAQQAPAGATSPWSRALEIRIAQGWMLKGDRLPVLYTDTINGDGVGRDDLWLCTTSALAAPAAPSTPEAGGWMPIETAPKDGTRFLAAARINCSDGTSWWERHAIYVDEETGIVFYDGGDDTGWELTDYRFWQPLPASPTIEGESGKEVGHADQA